MVWYVGETSLYGEYLLKRIERPWGMACGAPLGLVYMFLSRNLIFHVVLRMRTWVGMHYDYAPLGI